MCCYLGLVLQSSEDEEIPFEARLRMRNVGR